MKRLVALAALLAAAAAALYVIPSDHYLFLPDPARPVDPLVEVPGEERRVEGDGVYMVDILVRKANLLERLFPSVAEGSSLVPGHVVNPEGLSESERRERSLGEMSASQKVAVAVALRELGYDVPTETTIADVQEGAPADGELEVGDVVVAVKGSRVRSPEDLLRAMRGQRPGEPVALTIRRDGKRQTRLVGTRAAEEDRKRAVMGILVEVDIDPPIDVEIDAGDIGGPSAGLAFALDVVDELGRDVDRGRRVAVTGELDLDGTVGEIGGVKQKALGAREAGADIFVVPDENAAEARRYAGSVDVVAVSEFDEALDRLRQ